MSLSSFLRKPKPGMLLKAAQDFNISLEDSWMIGDGENDVKAGKAAGVHTGLITDSTVEKNSVNGKEDPEVEPDITGRNLLEIVKKVL